MTDEQWKMFFLTCAETLGRGSFSASLSQSWCAWTTYGRLSSDAGYWTSGCPNVEDICEHNTRDGGVWGQPFEYKDLAHIVIPKTFFWETIGEKSYECGERIQTIELLAEMLSEKGINPRLTELILEIKLY